MAGKNKTLTLQRRKITPSSEVVINILIEIDWIDQAIASTTLLRAAIAMHLFISSQILKKYVTWVKSSSPC